MSKFVIVQERSTGNETVGNAWVETATFGPDATLREVWAWAEPLGGMNGRTMIRPDMNDDPRNDDQPF